ncbi:Holliday junction resolvase [Candidatus Woesearchaeota archaeon]|nr:MAG: Holliday junction resolvase [Candidatus Woesearchaeota archaeon]
MNQKRKGTNAERELIKIFWEHGWACMRSAGSGSTQYPSPDILAGNSIRKIGIECKLSSSPNKYFSKEEIKQLINFCSYFGAEAWIAVKFKNKSWHLFSTEDLVETEKGYALYERLCDLKGLNIKEFFSI